MGKKTIWKRLTALILTAALAVEFTSPALASVVKENDTISVLDADGNLLETGTQADWEAEYPYGTFAFKETQINLKEGAADGTQKGVLTVYRLGGTEGRAEAYIALVPAAAEVEEGRMSYAYAAGTAFCDLQAVLPGFVIQTLRAAIADMDRRLHGFAAPDALLTAVESRFSSPVRVLRGESLQSVSAAGVYPCGEGCGYSGGITSSAADGIRVAEAICSAYGG